METTSIRPLTAVYSSLWTAIFPLWSTSKSHILYMQFFDKVTCIHSPPSANSNNLDCKVDLSTGYHYLVALINKEI